MTIREAVYKAFKEMNEEFSILTLIKNVRVYTERPKLTDGSITKRLRELRLDFELNYEVIDNKKAIYRKLNVRKRFSKPTKPRSRQKNNKKPGLQLALF